MVSLLTFLAQLKRETLRETRNNRCSEGSINSLGDYYEKFSFFILIIISHCV